MTDDAKPENEADKAPKKKLTALQARQDDIAKALRANLRRRKMPKAGEPDR